MKECTGIEITQEWLYHMGVPESEILELATKSANCIPCMMPYVTAFFMPRTKGDRPNVVPDGCTNFAFIGQFSNTVRDTVFTIEYSARTAMEAVYTLLNVDRGVPEVFGSCYDIRVLLDATSKMLDGKKLIDVKVPFLLKLVEKQAYFSISPVFCAHSMATLGCGRLMDGDEGCCCGSFGALGCCVCSARCAAVSISLMRLSWLTLLAPGS